MKEFLFTFEVHNDKGLFEISTVSWSGKTYEEAYNSLEIELKDNLLKTETLTIWRDPKYLN